MFSPYGSSGFYRTPVSKGVLGTVVLTSFALNVPLHHYRPWFIYSFTGIIAKNQFWRLFLSKLAFLDPKDLVCGAALIYYFRVFERRFGSHKFASYLFCTFTVSTCLELAVQWICHRSEIPISNLPSGPYFLIFPLFVPFFCDIPRVAITHLLGIPVTGKSFTYILGLQIASSSTESLIVAGCGIIAGLIYLKNVFYVQSWLCFPKFIAQLSTLTIGKLIHTPSSGQENQLPMGATLEIQRQQQMEKLEQQLAWAQLRQARPQRQNQPQGWGIFGNQNVRHRQVPPGVVEGNQQPASAVSETQVQQLVEMGFTRDSVLQALQVTNNDIQLATNVLLQEG